MKNARPFTTADYNRIVSIVRPVIIAKFNNLSQEDIDEIMSSTLVKIEISWDRYDESISKKSWFEVTAENKGSNYLWRGVFQQKICDYFSNFQLPADLKKVNLELIGEYIKRLSDRGELTSWNVVLLSKDDATSNHTFTNGISVGCWTRNRAKDISNTHTYFIRKNHIVGNQTEEFIDLDEQTLLNALQTTKEEKEDKGEVWDKEYPSPKIVRERYRSKTNPLLMIYPLNPEGSNVVDDNGNIMQGTDRYTEQDEPFIGFAISFPSTDTNEAVAYRVNMIDDFQSTEDYFDDNSDVVYGNE